MNDAVESSVLFWRARNVLMFAGDLQARSAVWKYCAKLQRARSIPVGLPPRGRGHLMVTLHPDDMAAAEVFAQQQKIAQLKRERKIRLTLRQLR